MEVVERQQVHVGRVLGARGLSRTGTETWSEMVRAPVITIRGPAAIPPEPRVARRARCSPPPPRGPSGSPSSEATNAPSCSASRGSRDDLHPATGERRQANVQVERGASGAMTLCRLAASGPAAAGPSLCSAGDDARPPGRCGPRRDRGSRGGSAVRGRSPGRPRCRARRRGRHGRGGPPAAARGRARPSSTGRPSATGRPSSSSVVVQAMPFLVLGVAVSAAVAAFVPPRRDRPPAPAAPDARRAGRRRRRRRAAGLRVRLGADRRPAGGRGRPPPPRWRSCCRPRRSTRSCSSRRPSPSRATRGRRGPLPREPPGGDRPSGWSGPGPDGTRSSIRGPAGARSTRGGRSPCSPRPRSTTCSTPAGS